MGRRSSEEAENHWPGFVDALSTIVMVVTFLLIILSIAIFVLSQSVAKSFVESQTKVADSGGGDMNSPDAKVAVNEFKSAVKSETPQETDVASKSKNEASVEAEAKITEASNKQNVEKVNSENEQSQSEKSGAKQTRSNFESHLSEEVTAEETPESDKKLSIITRKPEVEEERIVVASEDRSQELKPIRVKHAATILTLQFDKSAIKIDAHSAKRVEDFLKDNESLSKEGSITIWSFTGDKTNSISEAKRIAYYRALAARNELLKNGFSKEDIGVEVRIGNSKETHDTVQIAVVPPKKG